MYDIQSDLRKAGATARIFRRFAQDCILKDLKDLKMDPAGRTLSCFYFIDYSLTIAHLNFVQFYVVIL